jgi:hypothetical protein
MTKVIEKRKVPQEAMQITSTDLFKFELLAPDPAQPELKREWSMLVNTGKIMQRFWGSLVLDLAAVQMKQRTALLLDHWTDQRLGFSTEIKKTPQGLVAKGKLLDNELATQVMKDSAAGFPFQASLRADAVRVQMLDDGEEAEVNGQQVQGPLAIYREWELRELTITVLGADSNTATEAFAPKGDVEVAFERNGMVKKIDAEPAKNPADLNAAQVPQPQPATTPAPEPDGGGVALAESPKGPTPTEVERKRAATILATADPSQAQLAHELVEKGTELTEALAKLAADLRTRLGAAQARMRSGTEPIAAGNGSGDADDGVARLRVAAEVGHDGEEDWKKHFHQHPTLQAEFIFHGEDKAQGERRFLSLQRFAKKHLKGSDRQAMLYVPTAAQRLAAETALQPLTVRGIRGDFYLGLEQRDDSWVNAIASIYQTDAPTENYPFLGQVPRLRKFEGPRAIQPVNRGSLTIVNDDYEDTWNIEGKDWRRDKTQQISNHVQDMGQTAGELPLDLISTLLATGSTTALAWDGAAFFGSHTFGQTTLTNNLGTGDGLAGGSTPTSAQMAANIFLMIQQLLGFKDDQGRPFNQSARSFVLMIPTALLKATEGALSDQFTSAGVSNTLVSLLNKGNFKIRYFWNGRLTAGDEIFLWRDDARVKPFIYQEEFIKAPYLLAEGSEFYQQNNKVQVGTHASGGAAPGKYELIIRGKLT